MEILDIKVRYKHPKTGEVFVLTTTVLGDMSISQRNPYSPTFKLEGPIILKEGAIAYTVHTDAEKFWWERPEIDKAYYNEPATVVLWKDGTKTIVTAQPGELYDEEKGLAMAYTKKALGNEGNYYKKFSEKLPE